MTMITPNGKKIEDYISELKLDRNNIEVCFIQHKMFEKNDLYNLLSFFHLVLS